MIEVAIAIILVTVSHFARLRFGLNIADEGYLWNGALRIGQGKVPIRDYKSYDPGRFYWVWAWMHLFGRGLFGMRHSIAMFQILGLWAGLTAIATRTDNIAVLSLSGVVLVLWMMPRHKVFEHAYSLIAVLALTLLIQERSIHTALLAGVMTGFAGVMGRNHAVYCLAASGLALLLVAFMGAAAQPGTLAIVWGIGMVIGYAPMLVLFLVVPRLLRCYVEDKVLVFFRRRGTDLALPYPWPWRQNHRGLSPLNRLSRFVTGVHFALLPVFYVGILAWAVISPNGLDNACLAASCLVGLFYMHHASTRSDVAHLSQVTQPFLTALLALSSSSSAPVVFWGVPLLLLPIGWLVVRQIDVSLIWIEARNNFIRLDVLGDTVVVPRGLATEINNILALLSRHLAPTDRIFIAPMSTMLYPILQKETPVHSDFLHFPETESKQSKIIDDLERNQVHWALVNDIALDQRDELRFRNTHTKVWAYLQENFQSVQTGPENKQWSLWRRRYNQKPDHTGPQT